MKKKVIRFSISKYRKWCKENNEPFYSWANDCDNEEVKEDKLYGDYTTVKTGYYINKKWVVIRYE